MTCSHEIAHHGDAGLVYFSGITLAILTPRARETLLKAIASVRSQGSRVAFDPNYRPSLWPSADVARSEISRGAANADIVLPAFSDDNALFGDSSPEVTAARYLALGPSQVAVNNGSSDALHASAESHYWVGPRIGVKCIDPTAAGDSFNGAFLAANLRAAPPVEAMAMGHAVAAKVIGQKGALVAQAGLASVQ